jgi:hypothetical protein
VLVLALVSPFAALGFLCAMQGIENWLLGAPPDALPQDAIAVARISENDLADQTTIRHGAVIEQPKLSAVAAQPDPLGPRAQQISTASYSNDWLDAA